MRLTTEATLSKDKGDQKSPYFHFEVYSCLLLVYFYLSCPKVSNIEIVGCLPSKVLPLIALVNLNLNVRDCNKRSLCKATFENGPIGSYLMFNYWGGGLAG